MGSFDVTMMPLKGFDPVDMAGESFPPTTALADRLENDRLRQVMGAAGHDLKQPLQVIAFVLDRLSKRCVDPYEGQWLKAALDQTHRLNSGLTELLEASRRSWWTLDEAARRPVELGEILEDCRRDWALYAASAGVSLTIMPSRAIAMTDPRRLRAVLDNLLGNAIKYSPGGRVVVGCRRRDGALWLEVADNGCGICPMDQARIFERFQQVDPSRDGVGLGLALVRDHCQALGHELKLTSTLAAGTVMAVKLSGDRKAPCA